MKDEDKKKSLKNEAPDGSIVDAELPLPDQAETEDKSSVQALEEPEEKETTKKPNKDDSRLQRFKHWFGANKKKSIPLSAGVLLLLLLALPLTRYKLAGLVVKKDFIVQIVDSTANTPVSGAKVSSGSQSAETDGNGQVVLHLPVGNHNLAISKKHYTDTTAKVLVPILSQKNKPELKFVATGRQVKVLTTNVIGGEKISDVKVTVADVEAKTDKDGSATIVLPAGSGSQKASLSADGFNLAEVTIEVSEQVIKENKFNLTPSGKIYFLSKKSGKIDVVKSNLDGTERTTILGGTGKEDDTGTVLLASRDWKYLALLSKRDGGDAKLFLIETDNDKISAIDEGNANFNLSGWSDDNFVYRVERKNIPNWQPNAEALKSFNAKSKQLIVLNQTNAGGSNDYDYAREVYGSVYLIDSQVVYEKSWNNNYSNPGTLVGKQDGIYSISATGSGAQTLKTFNSSEDNYVSAIPYEAQQVYYRVEGSGSVKYFAYTNGKLTSEDDLAEDFSEYYLHADKTYLQSPSGNQTFFVESRDGKNVLMIGDQDGGEGKEIITLSDEFRVYGWFSNEYVLVSKKSSELYIMPRAGVKEESKLLKISDYHKPAQTYYGYGGGYGGI